MFLAQRGRHSSSLGTDREGRRRRKKRRPGLVRSENTSGIGTFVSCIFFFSLSLFSFFLAVTSCVGITVGQANVILRIAMRTRIVTFEARRKSAAPELGTILSSSPVDDSPADSDLPEIKSHPRDERWAIRRKSRSHTGEKNLSSCNRIGAK